MTPFVSTTQTETTFRQLHESGCFVHPQSMGCGERPLLRLARLSGTGVHQRGSGVFDGPPRLTHFIEPGARA